MEKNGIDFGIHTVNHPRLSTLSYNDQETEIVDSQKKGVIEPVKVKEQAIKSAAGAASMILRIDDVIASTKSAGMPPGPPGGPGGPGGDFDED